MDDEHHHDESQLTDEERARLYREQLKRLRTIDLVQDMMVSLVTIGYQKLGLTDETRDLRDLGDARVAIEALRRLIEVLEGEGERDQASALHATLASMQLAFARVAAEPEAAREKDRAGSGAETKAGPEVEGSGAAAPSSAAEPEEEVPAKSRSSATRKAGGGRRGATAAKKPAAKKPAARKPAVKKPSAKKPRPAAPDGDS
jgi:hypothetical protein